MAEVWTDKFWAHRALGFGDENTLGAYDQAIMHGIKKLETDVGFSRSGTNYLLHDERLDRTTNGRGLLRETPDDVIETLSAGRNPQTGKPEPIPRLDDFLERYGQDETIEFDLDLRVQLGIGAEVHKQVVARNLVPRVLFSSRDLRTLQDIKRHDSDAKVGLVVHDCSPRKVPKIAKAGVDVLKPHTGVTTKALLNACHDNDMKLNTWIYGTRTGWDRSARRNIHKVLELGVDGIYINTPFEVIDLLKVVQPSEPAPLRLAA